MSSRVKESLSKNEQFSSSMSFEGKQMLH